MNSPTYRFTPAMFRAVTVDRIKTQTRRVITPDPPEHWTPGPCGFFQPTMEDRHREQQPGPEVFGASDADFGVAAPYGPPGTIKPVVTTWAVHGYMDCYKPSEITEVPDQGLLPGIWWNDGTPKPSWAGKSRPAMFFPKHLYHLAPQARCVAVKAERVQDISETDAQAEGAKRAKCGILHGPCRHCGMVESSHVGMLNACPEGYGTLFDDSNHRDGFYLLWNSINAERGKGDRKGCYAWDKNPFVFATTLELV